MDVGLRGNRAVLLQQFISQGDHTLRPGFEFWITGAANLWIPATAPSDSRILINNATTNPLTITASGGTPIFGIARSTGAALPEGDRVRILPGQQASFVMGDRGWIAQGCERSLTFTYNGTPLSLNDGNPNRASDVIHYWGGVATFVNPATNGTIIATQSSTASGAGSAVVTTDRVATPSAFALNWRANNAANSWIAWQFPADFAPTGILIQTAAYTNNYHPRSFRIHYSNDLTAALTPSTPVSGWTQGPGWVNQGQITGAGTWHLFPFSGANTTPVAQLPRLRRLAIFFTGPSSDGANFPTLCEVNFFGDLFV